MSDNPTTQELEQYVDWLSLNYYDERIKDYIDARCTEDLKIGGEVSSAWLSTLLIADNMSKLYIVTDSFTTDAKFVESNVSCDKGTLVYITSTDAGLKYKVLVRVIPQNTQLSDDIDGLSSSVDRLKNRVEVLETDFNQLQSKQTELKNKIDSQTVETAHKFELIDSKFTSIHHDITDVENDVSDLRTAINRVDGDMTHLEGDLDKLDHDVHNHVENRLESLSNQVTDLSAKVNDLPRVDLTEYATEEYVQEEISKLSNDYVTNDSIDKKIEDLVGSAPAGLNTIEELASALQEHNSTLDTLDDQVQNKANKDDLARVATTGSYSDLTNTPVIPSVDGLASEEFVQQKISEIPEVDLSGYVKTEDLPDTSSFLTEIPEQYVTDTELESKGYLTQHQSLDGFATEDFVMEQIANAQLGGGDSGSVDLSYLATKNDLVQSEERITEIINNDTSIKYGTF